VGRRLKIECPMAAIFEDHRVAAASVRPGRRPAAAVLVRLERHLVVVSARPEPLREAEVAVEEGTLPAAEEAAVAAAIAGDRV